MSVVDEVRNLYEERDRLKRELDDVYSRCRSKLEDATTKLAISDMEKRKLQEDNDNLRRELCGKGRR